MIMELTEEEMRRALFGGPVTPALAIDTHEQDTVPDLLAVDPSKDAKKKQVSKSFTARQRVTLRVGNEFEGKMHEIVYEADTLSSLFAQQEATRTARKKFRFVEVVSIKSM
ncbi:hypothetical protein [Pseudomonas sp. EYE_354]|uniref:hypothetical protein n=1 Tax=Pseudomonas sp. EYE_354 TaxID=2853449 RepID=UPI0020043EA4|nr:hypothetical protein [Pseudomonas sp. EYE_354]MCK6189780.1 hypothetical protein [Pseudomonas sp. EYE_354]